MKAFSRTMIVLCLALVVPAQTTFAQAQPAPAQPAPERPAFGQEQLDQMLAPIALHPDPLLSQILMASTYPLEVVQAARWSRANPNLKGEAAVKAVEGMNWDPSVKSLVAFPEILQMMDERLEWTEDLGEAFLAQQAQVLDTIQGLRRRAEAQGNLQPDERMAVRREGDYIGIEPPDPGVVHVPYYDPRVAYGPWWAPAYPPVYWGPPPAYYAGWGPGFWWGPGVVVSSGFFFGAFNWPHRHVTIVHFHHHRALYARRGYVVTARGPVAWRHDVYHRRSVPYRQAVLRQEFRQGSRSADTRREQAVAPATRSAPVTRSTPGDRAGESRDRDRRSEQRVESAPRQSRQDAPAGAAPRPRAEAPVVNRAPETRRGADAPPARRPDAERRETPRSEPRSERSEQTRQQQARRSDDARSTRVERSSRARVASEERSKAHRTAPAENRATALARERAVVEDRRAHRAKRSENGPDTRADRSGARERERIMAEERGGQRAERSDNRPASRAERGSREKAS